MYRKLGYKLTLRASLLSLSLSISLSLSLSLSNGFSPELAARQSRTTWESSLALWRHASRVNTEVRGPMTFLPMICNSPSQCHDWPGKVTGSRPSSLTCLSFSTLLVFYKLGKMIVFSFITSLYNAIFYVNIAYLNTYLYIIIIW